MSLVLFTFWVSEKVGPNSGVCVCVMSEVCICVAVCVCDERGEVISFLSHFLTSSPHNPSGLKGKVFITFSMSCPSSTIERASQLHWHSKSWFLIH